MVAFVQGRRAILFLLNNLKEKCLYRVVHANFERADRFGARNWQDGVFGGGSTMFPAGLQAGMLFSVSLFPCQRVLFEGGIADFPSKLHCKEGKALAKNNEQNPGLVD